MLLTGKAKMDKELYKEKFKLQGCCVIIPTYNNQETLKDVVESVGEYTDDIIIVNDGSTDNTAAILKEFVQYPIALHSRNKGKGAALRTGFKLALEKGYKYAITIDSDGQHLAKDLPQFLEKLKKEGDSVIIGARNMNVEHVPKKSNVGNSVSTFWFRFETGIKLEDTQSGYRLYPIHLLKNLKFFSTKYDFEIEVIVKAAWKGIKVVAVPVSVYYAPEGKRVSHFKPFKDTFRITLLNILFVFIAVLYVKPLQILRRIKEKGVKEFFKEQFLNSNESNKVKALSVGLGVFMGIVPLWGFQMLVGVFLASLFKLNKIIVLAASNISIPPVIPFILYFSYVTGGIVLGNENKIGFNNQLSWEAFKEDPLTNFFQYYLGGVVLAVIMGLVSTLIAFLLLSVFRKKTFQDVYQLPENK